jgi:hypothetical protein
MSFLRFVLDRQTFCDDGRSAMTQFLIVAQMFNFRLTPPVHQVADAEKMVALLEKHISCFERVRAELFTWFTKTIPLFASESPPDIQARYKQFSDLLMNSTSSFSLMSENLQPVCHYLQGILRSRARACDLLEVYQAKIARVRKEETAESVADEGEALANFVKSLTHLNQTSNDFSIAFDTAYTPSLKHLIQDLGEISGQMCELASIPEELEETEEEKALDLMIAGLRNEIDQQFPVEPNPGAESPPNRGCEPE